MDKNLIKAFVLTLVVMFVFEKMGFFGTKSQKPLSPVNSEKEEVIQETAPADKPQYEKKVPVKPGKVKVKKEKIKAFEETKHKFQTAFGHLLFSSRGGGIQSIFFNRYDEQIDYSDNASYPLTVARVGEYDNLQNNEYVIKDSESSEVNLKTQLDSDVSLSTFISATDHDYLYKVRIIVRNDSKDPLYFPDGLEIVSGNLGMEEKRTYSQLEFSKYTIEDKTEFTKYKKVKYPQTVEEPFHWAGIQNNTYACLIKEDALLNQSTFFSDHQAKNGYLSVATKEFTIESQGEKVIGFDYYFGPKLYFHLKKFNLNFEECINYGAIIGPITKFIVLSLDYIYRYVNNYGLAIILLTLLIKILTYPLTKKSMQSMKAMQKIQPQMKHIQTQYKNDQMKMQQEMMALYKKHKVNPMSGCFPILIQMPLLIAFYKAIANSVELQGASFLLINDLAKPDALISFQSLSVNILPILMGVVQFFSSKQTTTDPTQKSMLYFFPIFMTVIFYNMASALVLYFLVSTLIGVIQNWMIKAPDQKEKKTKHKTIQSKK